MHHELSELDDHEAHRHHAVVTALGDVFERLTNLDREPRRYRLQWRLFGYVILELDLGPA